MSSKAVFWPMSVGVFYDYFWRTSTMAFFLQHQLGFFGQHQLRLFFLLRPTRFFRLIASGGNILVDVDQKITDRQRPKRSEKPYAMLAKQKPQPTSLEKT